MKKEFFKLSAILCIITLVAALILAGVNKITAPAIALAEIKATKDAMYKIIPAAKDFEDSADDENLKIAVNEEGQPIGYCAKVTSNGYGGDIVMMVGMDTDMTIQGIEILSHGETAGLGAKITEDKFKSQFKEKNADGLKVVKTPTENPQEFEAVTGATISSRAVQKGIENAVAMVTKHTEEGAK